MFPVLLAEALKCKRSAHTFLACVRGLVMLFYPIFKKSYKLRSQSNIVPTYASDFSLSSPPKTNRVFQNSCEQCVGVLYPLLHQLLTLSHLTVPSPPSSAPTGSIWPFLPHTVPRPQLWGGQETVYYTVGLAAGGC